MKKLRLPTPGDHLFVITVNGQDLLRATAKQLRWLRAMHGRPNETKIVIVTEMLKGTIKIYPE